MKLRDIILPVVLVAISSCTKQELEGNHNGVPVDGVKINYSLPVSTVVETRSAKEEDEKTINIMHVIVFEVGYNNSPGKFVEIQQADITADGAMVKLKSSDGAPRLVYILANAQEIIDAALAEEPDLFNPQTAAYSRIREIMRLIDIKTNDESVYTSPLPTTPLPMVSDVITLDEILPRETVIGEVNPVQLKSCYAKLSLEVAPGVPLSLTSYAMMAASATGRSIFPYDTENPMPFKDSYVNYFDPKAFPTTSAPSYLLPVDIMFAWEHIYVIVRGKFGTDTEDTYYKIILSSPTVDNDPSGWFNILPNHFYKIKLIDVGTRGYPTVEEAMESNPSNVIKDIEIGDMTGEVVTNGQYYMSLTNQSYEVVAGSTPVTIATLRTDARGVAKHSTVVLSSIGDGGDFITGVSLNENTGAITATTNDIGGGAVVRVTVGNLHQDITITNADKPIALVDTDEKAHLTVASKNAVTYALSAELSDKIGVTAEPTKVTLARKDVLHTGLKYEGKITVTDSKLKVSYNVPVSMEMYTVNVGGTLTTDARRTYKKGGVNWATGHLTMTNIASYIGMMVSVDPEHQDGMYFKWMTEWGGKSLNGPFSDGSGRTNASVGYNVWSDIPSGITGAVGNLKYDPCYNAGEIPGISLGTKDRRKMYWRSPTKAEVEAMRGGVALGNAGKLIEHGARDYVNGRLRLTGYSWLYDGNGVVTNNLGAIYIDGEFADDKCIVYRMHDDIYPETMKFYGASVRCVRDNKRQ